MREFGKYPDLTLARARELFDDIEDFDGTIPEAIDALCKPKAADNVLTVKRLARRYVEEECEPYLRSTANQTGIFEGELIPKFGELAADKLTPENVLSLVQAALDRGSPRTAQEILKQIKALYNWALGKKKSRRVTLAKEDVKTAQIKQKILPNLHDNPADTISIPKYKARSHHLENKPLKAFPALVRESALRDDVKNILLIQLMTFCRVGEVARAPRSEFNLKKGEWLIPAARYKTGRDHLVMLSTQVIEIFKSLPGDGEFWFPQPAPKGEQLGLPSREIAKELNKRRKAMKLHKDFSSHSLRHSGATWLASQGCPVEVRERLLGHVVDDDTDMSERYQHHEFIDERREWTQKFSDWLEGK